MQELWPEVNKTLLSNVFSVPPGQVCILHAANFARYKFRNDATKPVGPQLACVRKILCGMKSQPDKSLLPCEFVFDMDAVKADVLVDELVQTCGGTWSLSKCRNVAIIGLPGSYRLELNDATAIGVAQVYAELHDADKIPLHVKALFFE